MKIGILFPDNDYLKTFEAFLKYLLTYDWSGFNVEEIRRWVVELFNRSCEGLYLLCQCGVGDSLQTNISAYLKISGENVYINNEVSTLINDPNFYRGLEFHYADFSDSDVYTI